MSLSQELSSPYALGRLLGGYWQQLFADRELLSEWLWAIAWLWRRHIGELDEVRRLAYWPSAPAWHHREHYLLTFWESELNAAPAAVARYGEKGFSHGMAGGEDYLRYGRSWGWRRFVLPLPPHLYRIQLLTDRLRSPRISWSEGIDYRVEPDLQRIVFRQNPFEIAMSEPVMRADGRIDRRLELWAVHTIWDRRYVQRQWGAAIPRVRPTSEAYADSVRSWWRLAVLGVSWESFLAHLADLLDIPYARHDGERLIEVLPDRGRQVLITTHGRYVASADAELAVPLHEPLRRGQLLTHALECWDLHRGEVPPIPVLFVVPEWVDLSWRAPVGFPNELVPVTVSRGAFTRVEWPLWGPDAPRLWRAIHERGEAAGRTLAHLLDRREQPSGEPEPHHLPSFINPLQFLVANVLRLASVMRIRWHQRGPMAQPAADLSAAMQMVMPHTMLIAVLELTPPPETAIMVATTDDLGRFDGLTPLAEGGSYQGAADRSRCHSVW